MVSDPVPLLSGQQKCPPPSDALLGAIFRAGVVLDGLEELAFSEGMAGEGISRKNYTEIPPFLVSPG